MRRETVTVGHKSLSYLISDPLSPPFVNGHTALSCFFTPFRCRARCGSRTLARCPMDGARLRPIFAGKPGVGMSDLAGDVIDLLDHLDVTRAAVVGCSMGGYVLFEMLKSAPRYISAVGLVSTRPGADNEEGRKNRQKMIEQVDREGVEAIAAQMVPKLLGATTQRDRPDLRDARAEAHHGKHARAGQGRHHRDDGAHATRRRSSRKSTCRRSSFMARKMR